MDETIVVDLAELERQQPCLIQLAGILIAPSTIWHQILKLIGREPHSDCRTLTLLGIALLSVPLRTTELVAFRFQLLPVLLVHS